MQSHQMPFLNSQVLTCPQTARLLRPVGLMQVRCRAYDYLPSRRRSAPTNRQQIIEAQRLVTGAQGCMINLAIVYSFAVQSAVGPAVEPASPATSCSCSQVQATCKPVAPLRPTAINNWQGLFSAWWSPSKMQSPKRKMWSPKQFFLLQEISYFEP